MPTTAEPSDDTLGPSDIAKTFMFGLVGVGAKIITEAPRAVRQARSDLVAARFIGEMAVTQGASQLRERLGNEEQVATANPPRPTSVAPVTSAADAANDGRVDAESGTVGAADTADVTGVADVADDHGQMPSVDDLAIPDYNTVPAIDVVMQLADLDADERARIGRYEAANRGRRTILGKVEQLRGPE